eukprot:CAMPEP_0194576560 /NCGR_PEP_ID=MMETSP0292-20121207/11647_1 /TAXON_ID=39354 /ORGANISM="Heterosigma akashiwo, Strain CCMP2393" /LENGTH=176 /DNA_ID=CAMNT_0039428675 /DNA_START=148 /DNA_END=675 /DNA_ORIENTATION=-
MYGNNVVHDSNKRSLEAIQSSYGEDPSKRQMTGVGQGYDTGAQQNAAGQYPRNPGQDPCAFYVRTGSCKFGQACKFDHPPQPAGGQTQAAAPVAAPATASSGDYNPAAAAAAAAAAGGGEVHPRRPGQGPCAFFLKTGECKFGATCKFDHPPPGERPAGGGGGYGQGGAPGATAGM